MAQPIEEYIPGIQSNGLYTNTATVLGSTLAVTGASTFTGAVSFSGVASGGKRNVLASSGNTSPTVAQSGSVLLFDSGTGIAFTLPAPAVGLEYTFVVANTVSSGTHSIVTDAASTYLLGALAMGSAAGTATLNALGNGSSHIAVRMNGTTLGGILGTKITVTCTSATQWEVSGIVAGSGSLATPFATT